MLTYRALELVKQDRLSACATAQVLESVRATTHMVDVRTGPVCSLPMYPVCTVDSA